MTATNLPVMVARPITVRPDARDVDVPLPSGCQWVRSVDDQTVVDVVPSISPMATEVSPEVTSVLTIRSGSSDASRCHSRPAHVSDPGRGAVVKAIGSGWERWVGRAVDAGRADAEGPTAEGPTAATSGGPEAAGLPASLHGLAMATTIPTTTRTAATDTSPLRRRPGVDGAP